VNVVAWYLALTLPLGPGAAPTVIDFGVHLRVIAHVPGAGAFATPFGYVVRDTYPDKDAIHAEELLHVAQWEALGPAFPLAYALTLGEPFEPYNVRLDGYNRTFRFTPRGIPTLWPFPPYYDMARMWQPDERRSPQWRLTLPPDGPADLRFMPAWRLHTPRAHR
jgi:hypothetical protein